MPKGKPGARGKGKKKDRQPIIGQSVSGRVRDDRRPIATPAEPRPSFYTSTPGFGGGSEAVSPQTTAPPALPELAAPASQAYPGQVVQEGPGGNVMVQMPDGSMKAFDAWGNEIPHLNWINPNPGGPPPPATPVWESKYTLAGAPSYWKGLVPSELNPQTEYAALMNAMLPFMSPEDQRVVAGELSRMLPDAFSAYGPEQAALPPPPTDLTPELVTQFTEATRAQSMLSALDQVKGALGKQDKDFGPGYHFLRQVADTIKDFGGTPGYRQSRQQYLQQLSALDPLLAETKGEALAAYGPLSRMLATPFFSAGPLRTVSKDEFGNYVFGTPNKKLFN